MIGLFSFFLTLIIYSGLIIGGYFLLSKKHYEEKKDILIHTAIIAKLSKNSIKPKKSIVTKQKTIKVTKKEITKKGGKDFTKGGEVNFDDIFKSVKENIDTSKLKQKKVDSISRYKGLDKIKKSLKQIKTIEYSNVDVTFSSSNKNKNINEIVNKIGKIWYEISNIPGEMAKIEVISQNGQIYVMILEANLDEEKQKELILKIKNMKFNKDFKVKIKFITKVNE